MLNSIFSKYSNKTTKEKTKDKQNEISEDFLNGESNTSMKNKCDEVMKNFCNLYNDDDEKFSVQPVKPLTYKYSEKKNKQIENANTTGPGWFNMKAPDMTPELKQDLKAIQLRHIIDPARFYKKMDRNNLPKFFQVGTIMDNIIEGKKNRLKKSEVKSRITEEFLESDIAKNYSLRKFEELQDERRKIGFKKSKLNKYKMNSRKKTRKSEMILK